ncbi:hypothetical protein [Phytohabitans houttuyneae]|jgi:hypothetical protein|uniref:Uncharacterized protein n=1 Tax=Phytohabitans houttuyneae TaxID=1076126 RepID=A0A6V8KRU1_9ACTN|nr:hypothetical protein [Phytohabitans houttuyneae]GFJ84556.1 hypothetical protein Phou_087360 [Phytohabitans houttuyneae]
MSTSLSDTPTRAGRATEVATPREDLVTVLLGACLIGGAMSDGWAHTNILDTIEGFFTPWHALLYFGFAATGAWIFFLAYRRRAAHPYWWRDAWPSGYRAGAAGVALFMVAGLADMVWHETIGVEVGLNAAFSPSHMLLDVGALLMLSSPLRSWWAGGAGGGLRAGTGVASLALTAMGATILLSHSIIFSMARPTLPYEAMDGASNERLEHVLAVQGVDAYLVTTLLIGIPLLMAHRRRATPGAAAALVGGVALFVLVMREFPAVLVAGALGALVGAAVADIVLERLDAVRGADAPLRLPIAGALLAAAVSGGNLVGLHLAEGVRWPVEMWTGLVVLCAVLGALLGGLVARPAPHVHS